MDDEREAIDLFLALDRIEDSRLEIEIGEYLQIVVVRDLLRGFAQSSQNHGLYDVEADGLLE